MGNNTAEKTSFDKQALLRNVLGAVNPHCIMPGEYFEEILSQDGNTRKKKMLSIRSWDGREIFTLERTDDDQA